MKLQRLLRIETIQGAEYSSWYILVPKLFHWKLVAWCVVLGCKICFFFTEAVDYIKNTV